MKTSVFSPLAEADIEGIWDYSADNWGPDQADHYVDSLRDACHLLATGEKRGRPADIRPGYLKLPARSHVIYYRDHGEWLEIIRVLHTRQDTERHL